MIQTQCCQTSHFSSGLTPTQSRNACLIFTNIAVACAAQCVQTVYWLQVMLLCQPATVASSTPTSGNREMPKDDTQQLFLLLSVHWQTCHSTAAAGCVIHMRACSPEAGNVCSSNHRVVHMRHCAPDGRVPDIHKLHSVHQSKHSPRHGQQAAYARFGKDENKLDLLVQQAISTI